jgi:hypothetical protein
VRIIVLLIVLLVVGLLMYRQLEVGSPAKIEKIEGNSGNRAPKVPVRPQDIKSFDQQINSFVIDAATDRAKQIEHQER